MTRTSFQPSVYSASDLSGASTARPIWVAPVLSGGLVLLLGLGGLYILKRKK